MPSMASSHLQYMVCVCRSLAFPWGMIEMYGGCLFQTLNVGLAQLFVCHCCMLAWNRQGMWDEKTKATQDPDHIEVCKTLPASPGWTFAISSHNTFYLPTVAAFSEESFRSRGKKLCIVAWEGNSWIVEMKQIEISWRITVVHCLCAHTMCVCEMCTTIWSVSGREGEWILQRSCFSRAESKSGI